MKIGIAAVGSTGDIQPYLALARGLLERGHHATFVAAPLWRKKIEDAGVRFMSSGNPMDEAMVRGVSARMATEPQPLKQLQQIFEDLLPGHLAAVPVMLRKVTEFDVLVAHSVDFPAIAAAQKCQVPLVIANLFPAFIRARDSNPSGVSLGRWGNTLLWSLVASLTRKHSDHVLNPIFEAAGLPKERDVLLTLGQRARRSLLAVSPKVIPPDAFWNRMLDVTGYWFLDEPGSLSPELSSFLEKHPSPIVVTFGSMIGERSGDVVLETLRTSGRPAILQAGWAELGERFDLGPNMIRVGYVPHQHLFPKASCVIHHGGAGTTAAVLRAGAPHVISWHAGDQIS
jgi:sterol 3beta-glucosyltransferase